MAVLLNPQYGAVPGAPQALNWWDQNIFRMSGLVPPPAPPPPPLAATPTPQDFAAQSAFVPPRTDTGGGQPGGGGPGSGPGGLGGASGGGQDRTTSGYQGVYAQSPVDINSQFGQAGGMAGMLAGGIAGVPGIGTALSGLGGALDAARYNGTLAQNGLPGTVNPWGAAAGQMLASIGIPFTDINLSRAFGVPTARERMDAIINGLPPGLYNDQGYGAIAANAPHTPGAPFGNTGWAAGMNPTTSQFPPGFALNEVRLAAPAVIAANPDIFGAAPAKGAFDAGAWADALGGKGGTPAESTGSAADKEAGGGGKGSDAGQSTGSAGDKGDVGAGQQGGSGDTSREGGSDAYKYKGGLIGAPPGRYQQGGEVAPPASPFPEDPDRAFRYAMQFTAPYRDWYRDFNARFGAPPDLDAPDYNTRAAYQYGVQPAPYEHDDGHYHWGSQTMVPPRAQPLELKSDTHPTRWMQSFMDRFGTDPNEASPEQLVQALREGIVPMQSPGRYVAGGTVGRGQGLLRGKLYPGEAAYFEQHPNVAGMASDDNRVVLNPSVTDPNAQKAVYTNEAARLYMRQHGTPDFELTPEQRAGLAGTPYEIAPPEAQRATILGRILSGDPSGGNATPEQRQLADEMLGRVRAMPGYAAGGTVGRAAGRAHRDAPPVQSVIPDQMNETDTPGYLGWPSVNSRDNRGAAQGIDDLNRRVELGKARQEPQTGPLDTYQNRPSYATGGMIQPTAAPQPGDNISPAAFGLLRGINPPGPDDQIGALQTGEGVLTRQAMAAYPGLLAAANAGTLDPGRVKGLLTPAGTGRKPRLIR
jgi:hypothetical protein